MSKSDLPMVPRNTFVTMCILAAILLLLLLICFQKLQTHPGSASELDAAISRYNPAAVAFITDDTHFTLLTPKGIPIKPCGTDTGVNIPDECGLKNITVTHINTLSVLRYKGSDCVFVSDGPGHRQHSYHINPPGGEPCHHYPGGTPPHNME